MKDDIPGSHKLGARILETEVLFLKPWGKHASLRL